MSPIPGKGHDAKPHELSLGDGRKVKLKVPGLPDPDEAKGTATRGDEEPPRPDTRPPVDPNAAGL